MNAPRGKAIPVACLEALGDSRLNTLRAAPWSESGQFRAKPVEPGQSPPFVSDPTRDSLPRLAVDHVHEPRDGLDLELV